MLAHPQVLVYLASVVGKATIATASASTRDLSDAHKKDRTDTSSIDLWIKKIMLANV